jgi:hypothetical protein
MRPKERRDSGQNDLFKARHDQIVDMGHPLARLAATINWRFLEERFGAVRPHRGHQTRPAPPIGRRARHRPRQGRAPHGRNFLKGAHGDAANAVLAAAGYNFRRLLAWFAILWRVLVMAILADALDVAFAKVGDG